MVRLCVKVKCPYTAQYIIYAVCSHQLFALFFRRERATDLPQHFKRVACVRAAKPSLQFFEAQGKEERKERRLLLKRGL